MPNRLQQSRLLRSRSVWKRIRPLFYEALGRVEQVGGDPLRFLNYGYLPDAGEFELPLHDEDEADRDAIALYQQVLCKVPTRDQDILEIGAGRGGGVEYVRRYMQPKSVVALEVSSGFIKMMRERQAKLGIVHHHGSAMDPQLPSAAFDIVLNVESSHCYDRLDLFFAEGHRVLRDGGVFLYTDMAYIDRFDEIQRGLCKQAFQIEEQTIIKDRVLASLRKNMPKRRQLLKAATQSSLILRIPAIQRVLANLMVTSEESDNYQNLLNGHETYFRIIARK